MTRDKPWRNRPPSTITITITIAGVPIPREQVQWLADNTDEPISTRLRRALTNETRLLALEIHERSRSFRALEDPADGLTELRAVLLLEHVGRNRDGLVE